MQTRFIFSIRIVGSFARVLPPLVHTRAVEVRLAELYVDMIVCLAHPLRELVLGSEPRRARSYELLKIFRTRKTRIHKRKTIQECANGHDLLWWR